jgi:succinate dehydrogenase / fumarate reductase cytochrome b subunit
VSRFRQLYRSTLGKKAIVAVSGAMMLGFLLLHVIGNLKAFLPDASPGVPDINLYSQFLRSMGEPMLPASFALWFIRIVLAVALVLHIVCVLQLAALNRRARPVRNDLAEYVEATASGRWMLYTGSGLLLFLVIHLLQFTTGSIDATRFVEGAVYGNLFRAFQEWHYAALYLAAMTILALHLYHGAWSLFQSLGLDSPDRNRGLRRMAVVVAVGLALSFASVPVAFFSGVMKPPPILTAQHSRSH